MERAILKSQRNVSAKKKKVPLSEVNIKAYIIKLLTTPGFTFSCCKFGSTSHTYSSIGRRTEGCWCIAMQVEGFKFSSLHGQQTGADAEKDLCPCPQRGTGGQHWTRWALWAWHNKASYIPPSQANPAKWSPRTQQTFSFAVCLQASEAPAQIHRWWSHELLVTQK